MYSLVRVSRRIARADAEAARTIAFSGRRDFLRTLGGTGRPGWLWWVSMKLSSHSRRKRMPAVTGTAITPPRLRIAIRLLCLP